MNYGKAKKKPVEIDWFLWNGNNLDELKEWYAKQSKGPIENDFILPTETADFLRVKTLEGHSYNVVDGTFYNQITLEEVRERVDKLIA